MYCVHILSCMFSNKCYHICMKRLWHRIHNSLGLQYKRKATYTHSAICALHLVQHLYSKHTTLNVCTLYSTHMMHIHTYVHMRVLPMCTHMHVCIYSHARVHTRARTHTHTHTREEQNLNRIEQFEMLTAK